MAIERENTGQSERAAEMHKLATKMQNCTNPNTLKKLTEQYYMHAGGAPAAEKNFGDIPDTPLYPRLRLVGGTDCLTYH